MLRIMTEQHGDAFTLSLHGSVTGEWVAVLERYWQQIAESIPTARIKAILTDVSFIDDAGRRLLARMWQRGVEFAGAGCSNRHVLEQITGRRSAATRRRRAAPCRAAVSGPN